MLFLNIDQTIIMMLENVLWRIEYRTKLNNFFFARVAALLTWFFLAAQDMKSAFLVILGLLLFVGYLHRCNLSERVTQKRGGMNFNRIHPDYIFARKVFFFATGVAVLFAFRNPFLFLWTASSALYWYLIACTPLDPDQRDRFKKEKEARMKTRYA